MGLHVDTPAVAAVKPGQPVSKSDFKSVEFELALGAQDIRANGFEDCVRHAADSCGFAYLFNLPVAGRKDMQRMACVAAPGSDGEVFVFVSLSANGDKASITVPDGDLVHMNSFAAAYYDLLIH